jgi:transcriptional regulator GlxA family with amidase domain
MNPPDVSTCPTRRFSRFCSYLGNGQWREVRVHHTALRGDTPRTEAEPRPIRGGALRDIRKNPEKARSLTTLARRAKMHPSHFSEMFHQRLGLTVTRFPAGARVEKARQILLHIDLRIIEVAYAAGFGSVSRF